MYKINIETLNNIVENLTHSNNILLCLEQTPLIKETIDSNNELLNSIINNFNLNNITLCTK